jgi:DNA processing protein
MTERIYWLGFSRFSGIGPAKFRMLLETFWNAENAWNATQLELKHSGIGEKVSNAFIQFRKTFHPADYAEQLTKRGVSFITKTDDTYPHLLQQIDTAPFVLYVKGNQSVLQQEYPERYIAVVGTRKITQYGRQVTEAITEDLASAQCIIVSGLAMGVDAIAHASALRVGGKTIAVLGCGVDCCTPRENQRLYDHIIADGGAIISEAPLGHISYVGSFPSRNRIIAGLSSGVLVTEGAEDSGSLITAQKAFQYTRKVYAVPGPITSSVSRGPISLIGKGAKIVTKASDILDEIGLISSKKAITQIRGDTADEQAILDTLQNQHLQFDEIVRATGLPSSQVGVLLSIMEMKGYVQSSESGVFMLA